MNLRYLEVKKTLIADSGSTKTDWLLLTVKEGSAPESETFECRGLNPVLLEDREIECELEKVKLRFGRHFDSIRFYGAGVGNPGNVRKIEESLARVFDCPDIKADSDMAGAARAVLGTSPGIACIMGTGSNSCHYDGSGIDRRSASLGYILDDNGGGVAFGRRLLSDIFKGIAPREIRDAFNEQYDLTVPEVLQHLYRQPAPNRWLAGFMPFIVGHKHHPYMAMLIAVQLEYFFDREFIGYSNEELKEEGIGFVGSVAYHLSEEIRRNLDARGWKVRGILARPLAKLTLDS